MEQCLINASKDVLRFSDGLYLELATSRITIRESFCGSFASYVLRLQTLPTQEAAANSKSVNDSGPVALMEL